MRRFALALCLAAFALSGSGRADFLIRIGDIDGFGYGTAPGFKAANGGSANVGGGGVIGNGDFLPDINTDRAVATGRGDDFDLRDTSEVNNTSVSVGTGVSNTTGTSGSDYTDISLSTSYDSSSSAKNVLIGGNPNIGLVKGAGGAFPNPPSSTVPNQPGFKFRFKMDKGSITAGQQIFFNLIFGDYDVTPASILITRNDDSTRPLSLTRQGSGQDGLIQAATATLDFDDVFSDPGVGQPYTGKLDVDFVAPNEPYTAFDYVELSTVPLVTAVPVPPSAVLAGMGILTAAAGALRRRSVKPTV